MRGVNNVRSAERYPGRRARLARIAMKAIPCRTSLSLPSPPPGPLSIVVGQSGEFSSSAKITRADHADRHVAENVNAQAGMYLGEEEEGRGGGGGKHAALNHAGMLTTAHLSPRGVSRKTHYESLAQIRLIEYDEWRARARGEDSHRALR